MDKFNKAYNAMMNEGVEPSEQKIIKELGKKLADKINKLKKVKNKDTLRDLLDEVIALGEYADDMVNNM